LTCVCVCRLVYWVS